MTSSNGNIFRVTGPLSEEFTGPGESPTQRPVTRSFDVFFDLRLNKRLSKQSWGWWFETLSRPLWRQCNVHPKSFNVSLIILYVIPHFHLHFPLAEKFTAHGWRIVVTKLRRTAITAGTCSTLVFFFVILDCQWPLKNSGNSHRSHEPITYCHRGNPNLYKDQPITNWSCLTIGGHVSYPNDSPIAPG